MECYAYCATPSYNTKELFESFRAQYRTSRFRDIVHVEVPKEEGSADVFFFPYGAIVCWGLAREAAKKLAEEAMEPGQKQDVVEFDDFTYEAEGENSIDNDHIALVDDQILTKLAFSHPIAQSVKLGAFEQTSQAVFKKTRHLPESLAKRAVIPLSRRELRKKIGQLFLDRSSINLHLDVLDTPEFYWEHPEFEAVYALMANELDLESRTRALNQQLDFMHEMFDMLSTELNHQHSSRLEWAIIFLIVIEVLLLSLHDIFNLI